MGKFFVILFAILFLAFIIRTSIKDEKAAANRRRIMKENQKRLEETGSVIDTSVIDIDWYKNSSSFPSRSREHFERIADKLLNLSHSSSFCDYFSSDDDFAELVVLLWFYVQAQVSLQAQNKKLSGVFYLYSMIPLINKLSTTVTIVRGDLKFLFDVRLKEYSDILSKSSSILPLLDRFSSHLTMNLPAECSVDITKLLANIPSEFDATIHVIAAIHREFE